MVLHHALFSECFSVDPCVLLDDAGVGNDHDHTLQTVAFGMP